MKKETIEEFLSRGGKVEKVIIPKEKIGKFHWGRGKFIDHKKHEQTITWLNSAKLIKNKGL